MLQPEDIYWLNKYVLFTRESLHIWYGPFCYGALCGSFDDLLSLETLRNISWEGSCAPHSGGLQTYDHYDPTHSLTFLTHPLPVMVHITPPIFLLGAFHWEEIFLRKILFKKIKGWMGDAGISGVLKNVIILVLLSVKKSCSHCGPFFSLCLLNGSGKSLWIQLEWLVSTDRILVLIPMSTSLLHTKIPGHRLHLLSSFHVDHLLGWS